MKTVHLTFCVFLLSACLEPPSSKARDLCGDPPLISGIATFLTYIEDHPFICETADSAQQRAEAVSLTRQWEQCMVEARLRANGEENP